MIDHGISLINDTLHIHIPDVPEVNKVIYNGVEFVSGAQWIPCSERLPEIKEGHESDTVLCYTDMEAYAFSRLQENVFGQCGFECEREDEYYTSVGKVIAWMPLPEPYKEEEE